jgi:hypothetical protein
MAATCDNQGAAKRHNNRPRARMQFVAPMLAKLTNRLPEGKDGFTS